MQDMIDLLRVFVAFRTVSPDAEAKKTCLRWLSQAFLSSSSLRIDQGEVGGSPYLHLRHPSPRLLWFAHVDVVPGNDGQFALAIDGDRIEGRGVKDMKGATLAFLIAYRDACRAGATPPVSILITSDEEVGGRTPRELAAKGLFDGMPAAYTPDSGESPDIITGCKGAVWAKLTVRGSSGHGARPWQSDNPVGRLAEAILTLRDAFPAAAGDWAMTVSPTMLTGSDAQNRIPAEASCILDIRFPGEEFPSSDAALAAAGRVLPPSCALTVINAAEPLRTDPRHPMVRMLKGITEDVLKKPVGTGSEHGASDARWFSARGIPSFLYGPRGGDLHGEHEWVSLQSLMDQVEINARWLRELQR